MNTTPLIPRLELLTSADELASLEQSWRAIQQSSPDWSSPYYSWEYLESVADVRPTEAVVLRNGNQVVGIWPFHRTDRHLGLPLGGALNDYHSPLLSPGVILPPLAFLKAARLKRFDFHSQYPIRPELQPFAFHQRLERSWADLTPSPECYLRTLSTRSSRVARQPQKTRKIERELGPLRLITRSLDPADLAWLINCKQAKYRRTGCPDYFAPTWTRNLLAVLQQKATTSFQGVCSLLLAGDEPIAAHFGMQANGILHYWFPAFSHDHSHYSPGVELYLRIASASQELGFHTIDFGYGKENYKQALATHWGEVLVGSLDPNPARFRWNSWLENTRLTIKHSSYRKFARSLARSVLPNIGKPKVR